MGPAGAPPGAGPGDRAGGGVDVRSAAGRAQRRADHPGAERRRDPGPAARWYLLAGLLRCGICGRRLESSWSNHRPAYRCRHGYTSAARPDTDWPKNAYIREDQILPHLAALAILLADQNQAQDHPVQGTPQVTAPARTAELIDHLWAAGVTLTYDPDKRTLQTGTDDPVAVTVGQNR